MDVSSFAALPNVGPAAPLQGVIEERDLQGFSRAQAAW